MATAKGLLAQELSQTNPWWRAGRWRDPDLVEAEESGIHYRAGCLADLTEGGLYTLRGPRRSGKTVAMKQVVADLVGRGVPGRAIVSVSLDGRDADWLRTLVARVGLPSVPPGVKRWWFIDEISRCSGDWSGTTKWLRDNHEAFRAATVVLTGSNAHQLTQAIGVLAGRRGRAARPDRTLMPMGFRSFAHLVVPGLQEGGLPELRLREIGGRAGWEAYDAASPWLDDLARAFDRYLVVGGFPQAVADEVAGRETAPSLLDALFDATVRYAFSGARISEAETIDLLERIAIGLGSASSYANLARDLDLTPDTVARRVGQLCDAYLVWPSKRKDAAAWRPQERAQDKLYFVDPLMARLVHLRNVGRLEPDPTALAEEQIGMAIRRRLEADDPGRFAEHDRLFHWRTPTRKEIDYVADELGGVAVEGKYVDHGSWRRDAATVNASAWRGLLVTRSVLDCSATDGSAWAVPAGILAYLIDT